MTPEEIELRRALEARSADPSPEFRARLQGAFDRGRPRPNLMPALALATVVVLTTTSIGVLVAARNLGRTHGGLVSGARVATPSPIAMPNSVQLVAPSSNVIWALVGYTSLYRSTDQGARWEARPMPADFGVRPSISFIDDHEGWLLAPGSPTTQCQRAQAAIWHTSDGGSTWQDLHATGFAGAQCKEVISFADSRHGFVGAWDDNHRPSVYSSSDGGKTWKAFTLADPPDFKTLRGGFVLRVAWFKTFGPSTYLLVYGKQGAGTPYPDIPDRQYIYTSTNGGTTWAWKQKVPSRDAVLVTEARWLELSAPGRSFESTNGGQAFGQYVSDFNSAGARIIFADAQVGYADLGGLLQRTVDGGAHWAKIQSPGGPPLSSASPSPAPSPSSGIPMPTDAQLSAPSSNVVWALVAGQYLFRSSDQGRTWEQRNWAPYRGGGGPAVISFTDETNGWALFPGVPSTQCQQAGAQLWRTSDGAATWQPITYIDDASATPNGIAFDQCKEYMAFLDATHGFVAAHDTAHKPSVYRTSDGGATWVASTVPDPPGFVTSGGGNALRVVSIRGFGATAMLSAAGGDNLYVFSSSDGGKTWTYIATVSDPSRVDLSILAYNHWLIIQGGLETTDAGKTWHAFATDYSDAAGVASTLVFADEKVGYGTVRGGVHSTIDGGAHWDLIKTSWP